MPQAQKSAQWSVRRAHKSKSVTPIPHKPISSPLSPSSLVPLAPLPLAHKLHIPLAHKSAQWSVRRAHKLLMPLANKQASRSSSSQASRSPSSQASHSSSSQRHLNGRQSEEIRNHLPLNKLQTVRSYTTCIQIVFEARRWACVKNICGW